MAKSTAKSAPRKRPAKPKKPRDDFPLWIHSSSGYWAKKVKGKVFYFGKAEDDPRGEKALQQWLDEKDALLAGRDPRKPQPGDLTLKELVNQFLAHHEQRMLDGEISPRTFQGLNAACGNLIAGLGRLCQVSSIGPADFAALRKKLGKNRGMVWLGNEITRIRSVFKFAFDEGLIDRPMNFGQSFSKPKAKVLRRHRREQRQENGTRMFEAHELHALLALASTPLRAMILIGANTGFGQSDLGNLPRSCVDLNDGWIDFPRPKTEVDRRCPLWPETVAAIRSYLEVRRPAKNPADSQLLFTTVRGGRWVKTTKNGAPIDGIGQEFSKLLHRLEDIRTATEKLSGADRTAKLEELGITDEQYAALEPVIDGGETVLRRGRKFYALRHGFETIAGESTDQVAVDAIMGHDNGSMSGHYRERISDERLRAVTDHVRAWLFGAEGGGA